MWCKRLTFAVCAAVLAVSGCGTTRPAYVDEDARFQRAVQLRSAGEHQAAAEAFADYAREFPTESRAGLAQYLSGEELEAAGHDQGAFDAYIAVDERFPESAYVGRARAKCLEIGNRLLATDAAAGERLLRRMADRTRHSEAVAQAHMRLGEYYFAQGRWAEAKFEFDGVALEHPHSDLCARAQLRAALAEFRQIDRVDGNMEHVLAAQQRLMALRTAPLDANDMQIVDRYLADVLNLAAERHLRTAQFYLKQGELRAALNLLREVLETYPDTPSAEPAANLTAFILEMLREGEK